MFIEVWPNSKPRFAVPPQASQAHVTRAHKSVGVALQATVHDMKGVTGSHSSYQQKTTKSLNPHRKNTGMHQRLFSIIYVEEEKIKYNEIYRS